MPRIELFLLAAKLVSALREPAFLNGAWIDRSCGKVLRLDLYDGLEFEGVQLLDAMNGRSRQAPDITAKTIELHFIAREIPQNLQSGLAACYRRSPLRIDRYASWEQIPALVCETVPAPSSSRRSIQPTALRVAGLTKLSERPDFLVRLRKGLASVVEGLGDGDLREAWRLWLEQVAEKNPLLLKTLEQLQRKPYRLHPDPASILDFLVEHGRYFESVTTLSPHALWGLQRVLSWESGQSVRDFFARFFGGGFSLHLQDALESYAALKALKVPEVGLSLGKALEYSIAGRTGNLYGWLFSAKKILRTKAGPKPWIRAAIKADLGRVRWFSSVDGQWMTRSLYADCVLEYEDYDVVVEYKALLNFDQRPPEEQDEFFRQAEKYAAYLRKAAAEKGRPKVMQYYFYQRLDPRLRARLEQIFSGLKLQIHAVESWRGEEETLLYSSF